MSKIDELIEWADLDANMTENQLLGHLSADAYLEWQALLKASAELLDALQMALEDIERTGFTSVDTVMRMQQANAIARATRVDSQEEKAMTNDHDTATERNA